MRLAVASRYGTPPFDVSHGGGVFTSSLVERGSADDRDVLELNRRVLTSLGLDHRKLSFPHEGRPTSLTDAEVTKAKVVDALFA